MTLREKLKENIKFYKAFDVNRAPNEKDAEYLARLRKLKSMAEVDATLFLEFLESN